MNPHSDSNPHPPSNQNTDSDPDSKPISAHLSVHSRTDVDLDTNRQGQYHDQTTSGPREATDHSQLPIRNSHF